MEAVAAGLEEVRNRVVDKAYAALQRRHQPHYADGDTRRKLDELFERVVASVERQDPLILACYAERVAKERVRAGFDIAEVQAAFNVLEEALWAEAVNAFAPDDRIGAMEAVTVSLTAGRDALARAYVAMSGDPQMAPAGGAHGEHSLVLSVVQGDVGILTLNDEARRNALGSTMAGEICAALDSFAAQQVRAVILRSAPGTEVWSAGHDINELPRGRRDPLAYNDPLEQCVRAVRSFHLPVIAMVHGSVWGGAFDLVLSCDVVVADETATFAITPANLGLPYNTTGLLHFLGRIPVNVVKEMFFTAKPIDARLAERWLVINHLVAEEELEAFTVDLATTMASKAPLAITAVKEQLRVLSDYQPVAAQVYERIQSLRREAYDSSDYLEGLEAFAQRRKPVFRGS